jgi:hypothetical protein
LCGRRLRECVLPTEEEKRRDDKASKAARAGADHHVREASLSGFYSTHVRNESIFSGASETASRRGR